MGFSSGRRAYAGVSIDSIIDKLGPRSSIIPCVQQVLVDGTNLTAALHTQRTPNPLDPRPHTKYDEAFMVGVAVCALGLQRISLSTVRADGSPREAPDILMTAYALSTIGVEAVKVDETAAARVALYQVQERVVQFLRSRPDLKAENNLRFTIEFAKSGKLDDIDVQRLSNEIMNFFEAGRWRLLTRGRYGTVFADGTVAQRCGLIVEVNNPTYGTFLGFARADPMTPFEGILAALERKRKLTYSREHPLWLVVTVSDPRGPFREAIDAVMDTHPAIEPFEKVVVHDGYENVVTLP